MSSRLLFTIQEVDLEECGGPEPLATASIDPATKCVRISLFRKARQARPTEISTSWQDGEKESGLLPQFQTRGKAYTASQSEEVSTEELVFRILFTMAVALFLVWGAIGLKEYNRNLALEGTSASATLA
ncbi:unnamed protein product [Sympodiomycopsis kandeliae]